MPPFKIGTTVRYAHPAVKAGATSGNALLIGQVDRVIASSPLLVYVRWNDGSYSAVTENQLERY